MTLAERRAGSVAWPQTQSTFDVNFWMRPDFEHPFLKARKLIGGSMQLPSAYPKKITDRQPHHDAMFIIHRGCIRDQSLQ